MRALLTFLFVLVFAGSVYAVGQKPYNGFGLTDGTWLNGIAGGQNFLYQDTVPASGTTSATATQLSSGIAMYSFNTVPAGAGVALPLCVPGEWQTVYNNASNSLIVYPSTIVNPVTGSKDTINNVLSMTMSKQTAAFFTCAQPGAWASVSGGGGGSGSGVPLGSSYPVNAPLIGNGVNTINSGTRSGNTTEFGTANGTLVNGDCVSIDANGNFVDAGGPCTTGGGGGTVSAGATSQIAFYPASAARVTGSTLSTLYGGNAAATTNVPQLPLSVPNLAPSPFANANCPVSGFLVQTTWQPCPGGGFRNVLRNSSLVDARCLNQGGYGAGGKSCSLTVTTAGGWCVEGIYAVPVGGSITCVRALATNCGSPPQLSCLQITPGTSVTSLQLRFVQESAIAQQLTGQLVTFQMTLYNDTGSAFTPTLTTAYAGSADTWTTSTIDLTPQNLQPCGVSTSDIAFCTEAFTWQVTSVANTSQLGYEEVVTFPISGTNAFEIMQGFDLRTTPSIPAGINNNPPIPEIRDPVSDHNFNARYYQVFGDWGNQAYYIGTGSGTGSTNAVFPIVFPISMVAVPTMSITSQTGLQVAPSTANAQSTSVSFGTTNVLGSLGSVNVSSGLSSNSSYPIEINLGAWITADAAITGS